MPTSTVPCARLRLSLAPPGRQGGRTKPLGPSGGWGWRAGGALGFPALPTLYSLQLPSDGEDGRQGLARGGGQAASTAGMSCWEPSPVLPFRREVSLFPLIIIKSFCTGSWGFPPRRYVLAFWKGMLLPGCRYPWHHSLSIAGCPKPKRAQRFTNFLKLLIM